VLGPGTATAAEAADLQTLAAALPAHGFTVVLVTQPYRAQDNPRVADPAPLDQAWTTVSAHLARPLSPASEQPDRALVAGSPGGTSVGSGGSVLSIRGSLGWSDRAGAVRVPRDRLSSVRSRRVEGKTR
jgi:hypothetical protein